jgi:NTE family protein
MNQIKIPYAIATVDTITTKECIFLSKKFDLKNDDIDYIYNAPIAKATRASMSFPGVFTPCKYDKYNFIDGGTKDNLPVQVLKDMGATKTLALSFRIDDYEPKEDIFAVLLRTVDIFSLKDVRKAQKEADLAIEIDCSGTTLLEITNADEVVKTGYDTIMNNKEKILELVK